jgi:hypothetical protein
MIHTHKVRTMRNINETNRVGKSRPLYALVPRAVLNHLPIEPFEFVVCMSAVAVAWLSWSDEVRDASQKAGASKIKREKANQKEFIRGWKKTKAALRKGECVDAPMRHYTFQEATYKPIITNQEALNKAGSIGYRSAKKQLNRRGPIEPIAVEMSIFKLLKISGLSNSGGNRRKLDHALNRLLEPVGKMPAPLISWKRLPSGLLSLQLEVSEEWLMPPFVLMPLPLAHKSAIALDLYKFLVSIKTGKLNKTGITISSLCRKIGISSQQPMSWIMRSLKRALGVLNKHLARLPLELLYKQGIKVPKYTVEVTKDDLLRFESIPRHYRDDELDDDDEAVTTTTKLRKVKSIKRVKSIQKSEQEEEEQWPLL